jgi:Ni,Fe-hydrogenase III small subunit
MTTKPLKIGEAVTIPWGLGRVKGTVQEIYGTAPRVQIVVALTPALSGYVVEEPTTVTMPADSVVERDSRPEPRQETAPGLRPPR